MDVNIFLLDQRPAQLNVGGVVQSVGTLRSFWKITELDEERADELRASEEAAAARPSPKAAMVADFVELPLGTTDGTEVRAHLEQVLPDWNRSHAEGWVPKRSGSMI